MKNITTHTGIVTNVTRFDRSKSGNPRYHFVIDGYTVFTGVDSMHGYGITNFEGKEVTCTVGTVRGKLTLNTINKV